MVVTRRRFLTRVAATGGASLAYEAMTALGLLAAPSQTSFNLAGRISGVRVVILGAGLSGMTAAYELGKAGFDCRVLEARARPGGRVFTVRRGTASEETGTWQTSALDDGLYFNAGPMRISHHHHTTLAYADFDGYIAELLSKSLSQAQLDQPLTAEDRDRVLAYLHSLGALDETGQYRGSPRRGVDAPVALRDLFGGIPEFYVQTDWSSQPTMMQVAGGMDRLPAALAARLGNRITYRA
jgi:monoamine oxidase